MRQPWNIAVPSCVLPDTVAENARFLAGRVAEVGLCLFETQPSLEYGVTDLPSSLAELPLRWHAHLPIDLPWEAGGSAAGAMALAVLSKVAWLTPHVAVLHAPSMTNDEQARLLMAFAEVWFKHNNTPVLLENIEACSLLDLPEVIWEVFGICLDVGHVLAYAQEALLERADLMRRVALLHWSAPGAHDQHLPLRALTPEQRIVAQRAAMVVPPEARHMVEVFHWGGVKDSLPYLTELLENAWHPQVKM